MSLFRAVSARYVCNACEKAAVQSSSYSHKALIQRAPLNIRATPKRPSRCAFSTNASLAKEQKDSIDEDAERAFLDRDAKSPTNNAGTIEPRLPTATKAQSSESTTSVIDTSIPWYLRQNVAAREAQKPIELPELPHNPPPLLQTILEYISITAGLDDLELLDLRHLDPPPALGPKLIMIIATARSEKHLHVAADGFARYLRREHGLKANAAGLLGRNELKIKLRRKAKRMRMMANVGATMPEGNIDDGIRTGWICCTLSKIEAHPDDMHMPGDNAEFVGFRSVKPGVNVVVQMFTEEKRAETDLETLWRGVLKTHEREAQAVENELKGLHEVIADEDDGADARQESSTTSTKTSGPITPASPARPARLPPRRPGDVFPPSSDIDTAKQIRRLHTIGLRN